MRFKKSLSAAACIGILCATGCEPWGKPEPEGPSAEAITDFKTLFAENCSGCHGVAGKNGPGRILNDALYLAYVPKEALHQVIEEGRPGTAMPPWAISKGGPLTDKQVNAVVDGIESWKKPFDTHGADLPMYSQASGMGDAANGKKLFFRGCFACHGPGALVGPVTDPSYLSLSSNQNLRTSIVVGRPDLGMPNYSVLKGGHALGDQDVTDLVGYLASMRPKDSAMARHEEKVEK